MRRLIIALMFGATLAATGCGGNEKKIVGTWQATEEAGGLKATMTMEFTADGKLKVSVEMGGGKVDLPESTYKVEGDKLTITTKDKDGKEETDTVTIKELTDEKLVTEGGKKNKQVTLTKKK